MKFARELKETRIYLGYTQPKFAKLIKVKFQTYVVWELGRGLPSMKSLQKLKDYFGPDGFNALHKAYVADKMKGRRASFQCTAEIVQGRQGSR